MYFNDVHILLYVLVGIIGLIVGKIVAWCNMRLPENKKVFSKEFIEENKNGLKANYIFMVCMAIMYILILYKYGLQSGGIIQNLDLIKFLFLTPMLVLVISIDFKYRIIPNRLTLTMFEIGLIFTFLYGISNVNFAKEYILGMIVGSGIFLGIMLIGWLVSGKEAMGLGDVKFMGAAGLYFGIYGITEIALLSFFIAAICSIIILLVRFLILKKKDEYIAFGPFLSTSAIICIFINSGTIIDIFLSFCKMIEDKIL